MIRPPRTLEAQSWDAASNQRDTCPSCGHQFETDDPFCTSCGFGEDDSEGKWIDAQADKADADRDDEMDEGAAATSRDAAGIS